MGEWPCTWVGCRQWAVAATVLLVLLLMCYLCVCNRLCVCARFVFDLCLCVLRM